MIDIKQNLKEKGWTSASLAEALNIKQPSAYSMITGNPSLSNLQKIADVVGCSVSELVKDSDAPISSTITCPHCGKPIQIETKISAQ